MKCLRAILVDGAEPWSEDPEGRDLFYGDDPRVFLIETGIGGNAENMMAAIGYGCSDYTLSEVEIEITVERYVGKTVTHPTVLSRLFTVADHSEAEVLRDLCGKAGIDIPGAL